MVNFCRGGMKKIETGHVACQKKSCSLQVEKQQLMCAYFFSAMTDDPRFAEPIPNVTVALGRDASLPCVVENLGKYKVWYFLSVCY